MNHKVYIDDVNRIGDVMFNEGTGFLFDDMSQKAMWSELGYVTIKEQVTTDEFFGITGMANLLWPLRREEYLTLDQARQAVVEYYNPKLKKNWIQMVEKCCENCEWYNKDFNEYLERKGRKGNAHPCMAQLYHKAMFPDDGKRCKNFSPIKFERYNNPIATTNEIIDLKQ